MCADDTNVLIAGRDLSDSLITMWRTYKDILMWMWCETILTQMLKNWSSRIQNLSLKEQFNLLPSYFHSLADHEKIQNRAIHALVNARIVHCREIFSFQIWKFSNSVPHLFCTCSFCSDDGFSYASFISWFWKMKFIILILYWILLTRVLFILDKNHNIGLNNPFFFNSKKMLTNNI